MVAAGDGMGGVEGKLYVCFFTFTTNPEPFYLIIEEDMA